MVALSCACAASAALTAVPAGADVFSPIGLVSYGAVGGDGFVQQAEYAHDSAISGDGRYVVFDGSIGGVTGVWRRDLASDVVEQVAGGDAAMPSISENGRYVSFTTDEGASLPEITHAQPDRDPHAEAVDVYRRDMDVEPATSAAEEAARTPAERAFLAASVPSGSEQPLRYANPGASGGSYAVGRTAMSANGEEVAFVTSAVSNLVAYPALEEAERARGETPAPHTPVGQVAVHSFATGVTELVSRCGFKCGQGAAAGAAEPVVAGEGENEGKPVGAVSLAAAKFPAHPTDGAWAGASISADGNAVAWIGEDTAQQAPTLADEGLAPIYEEPLWRRLPAAANQTRRVTGGSDPEAPACVASGETALTVGSDNASDPCQGPFVREGTGASGGGGLLKGKPSDDTPRLSENGEEVVFGANARLVAEGSDYNRGEEGNPTDLFVVSMRPGLTRTQATTPLTEAGSSQAESPEVTDYEISPDGQQVAFSTVRTVFMLGQPTLVSSVPGEPGIAELYDADVADGTLTRVTHGYEGEGEQSQQPHPITVQSGDPYQDDEPNELGALTPDFSGNGDELVFTSTAANLVYGDGNSPATPVNCCQPGDGSDVFAVTRYQFLGEPAPQAVSTPPPTGIAPAWQLGVTARSRPNGTVLLYVQTPAPGALRAGARGAVVVEPAGAARTARRGHRAHRASAPRRTVAERTVATGSARAGGAGPTTLALVLAPRYTALARARGGYSATVAVTFTAPGHPRLREAIPVTFVEKVKGSRAHASKARRRPRGSERR